MLLESIHELRNPDPGLHPHPLRLLVHLEHLVHQGQVDHTGLGKPDPVRRKAGANRTYSMPFLVGIPNDVLEGGESLGLVEVASVDLVGAAPVGDGVEVLRERRIAKKLRLFVLGVFR